MEEMLINYFRRKNADVIQSMMHLRGMDIPMELVERQSAAIFPKCERVFQALKKRYGWDGDKASDKASELIAVAMFDALPCPYVYFPRIEL